MITTKEDSENDCKSDRPLAFHIRRLRQWYCKRALTQKDLADLAGINVRSAYQLETTRELPPAVQNLLSIALALQIPAEALVSPNIIEELNKQISERRHRLKLEGSPAEPDDHHS